MLRKLLLGQTVVRMLAVVLVLVLSSAGVVGAPYTAYSRGEEPLAPQVGPYGYAFTYQGQLKDVSGPVNGNCDFTFGLYDDFSAGTLLGTQYVPSVRLVDGLFTVRLDFGAGAHTGGARWLSIQVRCPAGTGTPVTLQPRQELTGVPAALALALPFKAIGTDAGSLVSITNGGTGNALAVSSTKGDGVYVDSAGAKGVHVRQAGNPTSTFLGNGMNGFEVNGAQGDGVFIGRADWAGVSLMFAGGNGVNVNQAGNDGVHVTRAGTPSSTVTGNGKNGFEVEGAQGDGVFIGRADWAGVSIENTGGNGVTVGNAGGNGLNVASAGAKGVHVVKAGTPSSTMAGNGKNGFEVEGAQGDGLFIGRADWAGVSIENAGGNGVTVGNAGNDGVHVASAHGNGIVVESAGGYAAIFQGRVRSNILEITGGSDLAEHFETSGDTPEPGTLMVIDDQHPGKLMPSTQAYDSRVAGVVSGAGGVTPGLSLQQEGVLGGNVQVAIAGRVYVKAEAASAPIQPGDPLTSSAIAGYAMKATDRERAQGTIIGKAMTALHEGQGLVLVLVSLQ